MEASTDRLDLRFGLRQVDIFRPVGWLRQRPVSQQRPLYLPRSLVQAAPFPIFRSLDQPGTQSVPLHVSHHGIEMFVAFDGKRLETPLIQVPVADAEFGTLPALGVHVGHPLHELRQVAIVFGPQHEMPMVRHPTVGTDADGRDTKRLFHYAMEGVIVLFGPKNPHSPDATIEHMKQHSSRRDSCGSWHDRNLTKTSQPRHERKGDSHQIWRSW